MFSKIKLPLYLFLLFSFFAASCGKDESEKQPISKDSLEAISRTQLSDFAKNKLGSNVKIFDYGYFKQDSVYGLAAGKEFASDTAFGIKFYYITVKNNNPVVDFETRLLNGSFEKSSVRKVKLADKNYELLYYDSQDNFIGSGGGEVFSYIIDISERQVFYAHFFTVPAKPTSLYLSDNTNDEVKSFFLKVFQKDYPGVKLVNRDSNLEDIF